MGLAAIRVFCLALVMLPCLRGAAQDIPYLPLRDWLTPPQVLSMKLSPDGKHVAGIGWARGWSVYLTEVDSMRTTILSRGRPEAVNWIANDLVAIDDTQDSWSMDLSGKRVRRLGDRFIRRVASPGDPADMVLAGRGSDQVDLVNPRTGDRTKYPVNLPGKLTYGAFDASGVLRAVTMTDTAYWAEKTKVSNWYRSDENAPWQLLEEVPITADYFIPLRVLAETNSLAVLTRQGRDTYAVVRYDTAKREQIEVMAEHAQEDIMAVLGLGEDSFESVTTSGIKPQVHWFDARWAALQKAVDAALPGRINVMQGDKNGRVLIWSYGDVDPGHWHVLDTTRYKLREIGTARPKIDPKWMRPMETIRYRARDGMTVPAYLTRPARPADKPAPMVVLIHGGPHIRDRWAWNEEVQILASYGYVVFQPQFRGSTGFGRRFEEAGHRQWGLAMQDDITDGVNALIEQKIADPARICIVGASYGGYAALWGVIKTPQLYRCGVSFAGVSDLVPFMSNSIFNDSTPMARELWRARIGDPDKERDAIEAVSPLKHAARVNVPMLIAHGLQDTRVLASQSRKMVAALEALGKPVEWMPFEGVGHGLYWVDDELRYYSALLSFLQRHIGDHDPAPPQEQGSASLSPAAAAAPGAPAN
ncbi:MAG TPA: S9 family peptidase [Albitalea sp.]|uniref:alpha/beta hydrolase family protein n=1 Tax=Piscinibacter sp. TaxID=1903157 RepID=UPI002ED50CB8